MKSFNEWLESKTTLNEESPFFPYKRETSSMGRPWKELLGYFTSLDSYSKNQMKDLISTAVFEHDKLYMTYDKESKDSIIRQANDALNKIKNSREFRILSPEEQRSFLDDIEKARKENDHHAKNMSAYKRSQDRIKAQQIARQKEAQQIARQKEEELKRRSEYDPYDAVRRYAANSGPWWNDGRPVTDDGSRRDDRLPPE